MICQLSISSNIYYIDHQHETNQNSNMVIYKGRSTFQIPVNPFWAAWLQTKQGMERIV